MKYYISIRWPEKRGQYDKPETEREYTAGPLDPLPFSVDTLEEAHAIIAMSKSPVWTIRHSEHDDMWQKNTEIECSPMVKFTRELEQAERVKNDAKNQARIDRINAQPKVVTKTYAGIVVTFERNDVDGKTVSRSHDTPVRIQAGAEHFSPANYITASGAIQKKKWIMRYGRRGYETPHPERERLVALAPYLKVIQAVADSLSNGSYKEEAT